MAFPLFFLNIFNTAVLDLTCSLGCNTGQLLDCILPQILSDFCIKAPRGFHRCDTRGLELVHILPGPVGPAHVLWVERVLSLKPICELHPAIVGGALIHCGQTCSCFAQTGRQKTHVSGCFPQEELRISLCIHKN